MAVSAAAAARLRLAVRGARAIQAGGFGCAQPARYSSSEGSIREAGGTFAKKEKAEEERYFRERTKEQLAALKKHHEEEIQHHKKEIERLQKEIERHKQNIKKLKSGSDD
ncbi:ATPase inhibitor, mitochondrial [Pipistrellus kuhlii]|uniref:ATPase inhibitor, mitochondrial n=1 Tax=Pipistrellus kuhlii TaxID=59472 RepID=A0A7J8A4S0_PIPKU|nr:ATPase inhibitor, mitochondrial [Pipistrellus kuhlii]KAF6381259.1 ATP synthase inhibitory factor subunit 1 [Pipistrellus kuhlii]